MKSLRQELKSMELLRGPVTEAGSPGIVGPKGFADSNYGLAKSGKMTSIFKSENKKGLRVRAYRAVPFLLWGDVV